MFRLVSLLPLVVLMGCGGGKPPTQPVTGKVMFKKTTPAAGALVVFHPTDYSVEKQLGGKPFGTVKEDGTFTLTSFEADDGAPAGEYGVTIQWQKKGKNTGFALGDGGGAGREMLQPKYGNPAQPFTKVTIRQGDKNEFTFNVD
jgi:hypothetical protein